jgi:hypothetical protein
MNRRVALFLLAFTPLVLVLRVDVSRDSGRGLLAVPQAAALRAAPPALGFRCGAARVAEERNVLRAFPAAFWARNGRFDVPRIPSGPSGNPEAPLLLHGVSLFVDRDHGIVARHEQTTGGGLRQAPAPVSVSAAEVTQAEVEPLITAIGAAGLAPPREGSAGPYPDWERRFSITAAGRTLELVRWGLLWVLEVRGCGELILTVPPLAPLVKAATRERGELPFD